MFVPVFSYGQTVNRTGDINFKNRATFGSQSDIYTPTDTTVWLQIGENNTTKGILMPRLADTLDYVGHPTAGTIIYQNLDNKVYFYNGNYWSSTASAAIPDLHDVLAAGDTATNDIYLGGASSLILGTTNSSGIFGGQLQYTGGQFTIGTLNNNNRILIDGAAIAIGTDVSNEYVGIGTLSPAYKLDVLGNTRFQNNVLIDGNGSIDGNLGIGGDSLALWNKVYDIGSLGVDGFLRNSTYTSLTNSSSSTFLGDLMNLQGNLEFDNPNSIHLETSGSKGSIAAGTMGFLSLNSSGTSTWIYTDNSSALTGLMGVIRIFNNANYGILSSITALPAYTYTQGAYTSFTGHVDTLSQLLLPSSITGSNIENKVGSNYGILQLSNYPNNYNGGVQMPIATSSTGYTVTTANYTVINTSGTNTFTMPDPSTCNGQIFHLICNTGTVTLTIGYLNYAGTNTTSIAAGSGVTIQSNGTSYYQIGQ